MHKRGSILVTVMVCALAALAIAGCGSSGSSAASSSSAGGATSTHSAAASTTGAASTSTAAASTSSGQTIGFEGVPLEQGPNLASAGTTQTGEVDGITCKPLEQLAYHIHAHLAVFDDGRLYALPAGVGIPGSQAEQTPQYGPVAVGGHCYYWLHTHTSDGVIHIESPTKTIYTLGDFFDIWHQPLSGTRVAALHGAITAFVNGKAWRKSPRDIPLLPHEDIQLEIGDPPPPLIMIDWKRTSL
jgi:hypothetical protein